jgi:hypothetical protein
MTTHRALPSLVIVVLVTVALSSVAVTVVGLRRDTTPSVARSTHPPRVDPQPEVEALAVLSAWDAHRAAAWAAGDARRLRALYTPGSVAGQRDVAMLRRWAARGVVVRGLVTQVVSLREVARSPDTWVLAVTDRLAGGTAVGRRASWRLPGDAATAHTVTLRRTGPGWRVSAVA